MKNSLEIQTGNLSGQNDEVNNSNLESLKEDKKSIQKDEDYIHYVYKITNKTNGKYYIGIHSLPKSKKKDPLEDGYWGSGTLIEKAIREEGKDNFKKEILKTFSTREEAFEEEKRLVTLDVVKSSDSYNLIEGGLGSNTNNMVSVYHKDNLDKAFKVTKEEYWSNKDQYILPSSKKSYLRGYKLTYKDLYRRKRIKKGIVKKNRLVSRRVEYINKNTLELKTVIGLSEPPGELYVEWFPAYFYDKNHDKFITKDYLKDLYDKYKNLKDIGKYIGASVKSVMAVRDYYIKTTDLKLRKAPGGTPGAGFFGKAYINDGKGTIKVVKKSELDTYLNTGKWFRGKSSATKEEVMEFVSQGNILSVAGKHFHMNPTKLSKLLGVNENFELTWFNKPDGSIIKLRTNDYVRNYMISRGWSVGRPENNTE